MCGSAAFRLAWLRPQTASGFLALAEGKRFGERAIEGEMESPPVCDEPLAGGRPSAPPNGVRVLGARLRVLRAREGLHKGETCPDRPTEKMRKWRTEEVVRPGVVDWPAVQKRLREQGIVLGGGGADEAPEVYKRVPDVIDAHGGTICVEHTLRPLGVAMAGRDVHDPYKD